MVVQASRLGSDRRDRIAQALRYPEGEEEGTERVRRSSFNVKGFVPHQSPQLGLLFPQGTTLVPPYFVPCTSAELSNGTPTQS